MRDRSLLHFLAGGKKTAVGGAELRMISAYELLQAQREAADMDAEEQTEGLLLNACILSRAAEKNGKRLFPDGTAVLQALPAQTIEKWMLRYIEAAQQDDPSCREEQQQRKNALKNDRYERLKWKVLRRFGVLPSESRAREMTDGDYLYCILHMMLDEEERLDALCPSCREKAEQERCLLCGELLPEENGSFDEKRFEELKHGANSETTAFAADRAGG